MRLGACGFAATLHSLSRAVCWQAFYSASAFNQNIGSWSTASVTTMYQACFRLRFGAFDDVRWCLPQPRLGRLPLLLGLKACLASSANTRRALCSRHCKRLGPGLARLQFHALPAWHTQGCCIGQHRCRVGCNLVPRSPSMLALLSCRMLQHHRVSRPMRLGAFGFAAGLHSL